MSLGSAVAKGKSRIANTAVRSAKVGASGIRRVAPTVGRGAFLAGGAAVGAAAGFGSSLKSKIGGSNPGIVLAWAGFTVFFLSEYIDNFLFALILTTFFMFYTTLTIFEGKGIITVTLFWLIYVYLFGIQGITDFTVIIKYYAGPLFLVGMLVHGLVKRFKGTGTFAQGVIGEITGGLLPIALFVFDLGLAEILANLFGFPASAINSSFLRLIPWWGMLGIFTVKKDSTLWTMAKVGAIFYLIIIIMVGVVPGAYGKYQESFIAGPQELFEARLEARDDVRPENPARSYATCFFTGKIAELDVCYKEEQQRSLAESSCKNIGVEQGSDFDKCVEDELTRLKKVGAKGTVDVTQKEFLKAEFVRIGNSFPKTVFNEPRKSYPTTLKIENPLLQPIEVEVGCKFKKGSSEVLGEVTINGELNDFYSSNFKNDPLRILCKPTEDLNGRYSLEIVATISDIVTTTTLTRVFVKSQADREKWEADIRSSATSGFSTGLSKAPGEFARLNFGFGNFPDDPIILTNRPVVFTASIEDVGRGRLSKVRAYILSSLQEKGFFVTSGDFDCLSRGELVIPKKVKNYLLSECFLELPTEYQQFDAPFIVDTFEAELAYDYTLTQKITGINVEIAEEGTS
jgi:hypothetical protein